jgi:hypothetical protein
MKGYQEALTTIMNANKDQSKGIRKRWLQSIKVLFVITKTRKRNRTITLESLVRKKEDEKTDQNSKETICKFSITYKSSWSGDVRSTGYLKQELS